MAKDISAILEIGTSKIRCLVGELREDNSISILASIEEESKGIKKGLISNRDNAVISVRSALKNIEKKYRKSIHSLVLVLSGGDTKCHYSDGIIRLADPDINIPQEVYSEDILDVLKISKHTVLPKNRTKLHSFHQYFKVDDISNVIDPLGMTCEELMVQMLTIHGKQSVIENFQKLILDIPIACSNAVYSGLASALAVTTEEMRSSGVLVIDIGGGTTDYCLYNDSLLKICGSFTVGGDHITNDIAAGLQIPVRSAEELKIKDGSALSNLMERDRNISMPSDTFGFKGKMIRAVTLNTIIEARMQEIYELIKNDINRSFKDITLGTGVLITGGGSYLNGSRDLAQKVFNIPCLYGKPIDVHGLTSSQESSKYSSLIGSIRYINTLEKKIDNPSIIQRILNLIWGKS